MPMVEPDKVERIAALGAGTMGGGWTAAFAARGIAVNVWDPAPDTEPRIRAYVEEAFPLLDRLGLLVEGADPGNLTFFDDPAEACKGVQMVQESVLEQIQLKRDLYDAIDDALDPDAVLATTSYLAHLAAVADTMPPSPGLKAVFGGGEGGGFSYLERLQEQWGVPFYNQFGATQTRVDHMYPCERGIGTRERPAMLHNIDPYFLVEVIDPETGRHVPDGEAGEIVVTSLIHDEIPLIRCAMSDRAVYHDPGYCDCGRPFCGVEVGTISRMDDMKKVKGINIWPQSVDDVMFAERQVDEYEIVLTTDAGAADVATARVMPKSAIAADQQAAFAQAIADRLRRRIGIGFAVEVVAPGTLQHSEYKARRWKDERGRD